MDNAAFLSVVPRDLQEQARWVVWRVEMRPARNGEKKPTKVPYNARTGALASSTDVNTWSTVKTALRALERSDGYNGVGFVTGKELGITGIDLDHCRDSVTEEIEPWALAICDLMQSYTEISPSQTGLRIFIRASLPPGRRRTGSLEMYDEGRFFTVTGNALLEYPLTIEERQEQLDALHKATFDVAKAEPRKATPSEPVRLDDQALLKKAQEAKNGQKFWHLWRGEAADYGDDMSRADLALCGMLAFWTGGDATRMDRLFRQSGLMRDKWDERRGESTYGQRTILTALSTLTETYSPISQMAKGPTAGARLEQRPRTDGSSALAPEPPMTEQEMLLLGDADDNGNAETMWRLYGHEFLFTPAIGWLEWTGTHWRETPEPIVAQKAITTLKKRRLAAVNAGAENIVKTSKQDKARVTGCLSLFKSYIIEPDVDAFDADPDLLNCASGVIDLRTGKHTLHSPKQRFTYCLSIPWTPDADMEPWKAFVLDALGGDQELADYIQLCAGYSLTGHTREEKMFYLYGPTRAGKGTFTETMLQLLPRPLSAEVDFATFTAKRDNDSQNFDLAALKPARFLVASESNRSQQLNTAKVKQMTGGNLTHCAFKNRDMFFYRPQYKVWLVSNWEVKADPDDDAMWGRVQVFSFPHSHLGKEDVNLKTRMKSPEVLQGVLRWAVEGAMRWYQLERLEPPEAVTKATAAQRDAQDYISQWIEECAVLDSASWAPFAALSKSYQEWCKANNVEARKPNDLTDTLVKRFGCLAKRKEHGKVRGYSGIGMAMTGGDG